jgi:RNA polymerase sigma-70 factor (ECF subfamily)
VIGSAGDQPTATERAEVLTFEAFFEATYDQVVRALLLITGQEHEAEDVAEEAFARTYERWGKVGRMTAPSGYVYRTGLNLYRSRLRHLRMRVRRDVTQWTAPDPYQQIEDRNEIRVVLNKLPRPQREARVLVEYLGYTAEEAGAILGIAPGSVRTRLHRARQPLRSDTGGNDE